MILAGCGDLIPKPDKSNIALPPARTIAPKYYVTLLQRNLTEERLPRVTLRRVQRVQ